MLAPLYVRTWNHVRQFSATATVLPRRLHPSRLHPCAHVSSLLDTLLLLSLSCLSISFFHCPLLVL